MRKRLLILSLILPVHALADESSCSSEYERGKREAGAYAEMLGIIEGTIDGHSLAMDDVPSREQSIQFLERFFLCK